HGLWARGRAVHHDGAGARALLHRRRGPTRGCRSDRRGVRPSIRGAPRRRRRRSLAAGDPLLARRTVTVDIRPFPRLGWDPLPNSTGIVGRVLIREDDFFVAQLRFSDHAAITEHAGDNDAIVVCLEGEGFTSVAGEVSTLREG